MGRLKALPPLIVALAPRLARLTDDEGHSPVTEPLRHLYNTARWKQLRIKTFRRDRFTCQMCSKVTGNTSLLTCDHVKPHKGDEVLFWAEDNVQTLCTDPCHNKHKQAIERGARGRG